MKHSYNEEINLAAKQVIQLASLGIPAVSYWGWTLSRKVEIKFGLRKPGFFSGFCGCICFSFVVIAPGFSFGILPHAVMETGPFCLL